MGLDQYAYAAARAGQQDEYWRSTIFDSETREFHGNGTVSKPIELAYWRKHPNLHGWMQQLWLEKLEVPKVDSDQFIQGKWPPSGFNGTELELVWDDIDRLEKDIKSGKVSALGTVGIFFGNPSDDRYYEKDLEFCRAAKAELFLGLKVFYNSSW